MSSNLVFASRQPDPYNRYTFYRIAEQLGTDSAAEMDDKINLNYANTGTNSFYPTNFVDWTNIVTNTTGLIVTNRVDVDSVLYPRRFYRVIE